MVSTLYTYRENALRRRVSFSARVPANIAQSCATNNHLSSTPNLCPECDSVELPECFCLCRNSSCRIDAVGGAGLPQALADAARAVTRRAGDCFCLGRRHLDGPGQWRRRASADQQSGDGVTPALFARWFEDCVHFDADWRRRYLRAHSCHWAVAASHLRRHAGAARCLVA
jgi:hypothetical protein